MTIPLHPHRPAASRPKPLRRLLALALAPLIVCSATAGGGLLAEVSRSQQLKSQAFEKMSAGIKAVRDGEAEKAIELLEQVARVAMNSFRAHYYLGLAYKADRQYLKATEPLGFAIDLDPTHLQAHVDLGDCWLKRGDTGEALAEYHRALEIQQGFAPAWDGLGRAAESAGDTDKAIEHFRHAIDLNPGFPDASLNLGDLYMREGRLREAVELFLQAISVRPDFAAAYNRLGVAYARQRLGNEAIAALRKASDLERGNPWHPYTIGLVELDLGYLGRALRSFESAIDIDEHYLEAYVAKARILRQMGRFEEAEFLLETAARMPSEDTALLRQIRDLREQYRRERLTLDDIAARAEEGLATLEEVRALAALRADTGDFAGAARALDAARLRAAEAAGEGAADPLTASDRFRLGYYHLRAGEHAEAAEAFSALRGEQPGSVSVLLNLGLALEGQGRARSAAQVYEDALSRRPGDPILLTALGNVMVIEGRYGDAISAYEKALASPEEFDGRVRVETILKALRVAPAPAPAPAATTSRGSGGG